MNTAERKSVKILGKNPVAKQTTIAEEQAAKMPERKFFNAHGEEITKFVDTPVEPANFLEIAGMTKGYKRKAR